MIDEKQFRHDLVKYTTIVKKFADGEIPITFFIGKYENFYHYYALDGHETNEQLNIFLKKYDQVIKLHKRIQVDVLDNIYIGDSSLAPQYVAAGRILPEQAQALVVMITKECEIDNILAQLIDG